MNEPRIVRTPEGEEMVVIPRAEYDRLLAAADAEDAEDVAIYDARMAELATDPHGVLPAEVGLAILKGESRVEALRGWRRLSQSALAAKAGIGRRQLSEIENRRRTGAPETLARLAEALDVPAKWLG